MQSVNSNMADVQDLTLIETQSIESSAEGFASGSPRGGNQQTSVTQMLVRSMSTPHVLWSSS